MLKTLIRHFNKVIFH